MAIARICTRDSIFRNDLVILPRCAEAVPVENFESELTGLNVIESKSFDDEYLGREETQDKRQYQELLSGVPEVDATGCNVDKDLEISDSDEEVKERNIDVPEKVVHSNAVEMDDDDQDGLWF